MGKLKDLTGMKFGRLTVVERRGSDKSGIAMWLCRCECGNEVVVRGSYLRNGSTTSCGCYSRERASENIKDETGNKYERLTVIERHGNNKCRDALWLCKCECGNKIIVRGSDLRNGHTTSCGCYQKERVGETKWKGGISSISNYLRNLPVVKQWRKDAYIRENNKCQLTGKYVHGGNSDVHHLYGFNMIVLEAHELYSIQIHEIISEYTQEELHKLEEYVASWHKDNSNAVVLCEEVHKLFHSLYGQGDNTPEQFEEFRERYLNSEFKDLF